MTTELIPKEKRTAEFSADRVYRYTLDIVWDESLPMVQFIGLNPSTADEFKDDPTVRRCKQFARNWGYGGMVMTNLFAFRSTDPIPMKRHPQPIGEKQGDAEENDAALYRTHLRCDKTVAAWGNHGLHLDRWLFVSELIPELWCFRITKAGQPEHPLYMPYDQTLSRYSINPIIELQESK